MSSHHVVRDEQEPALYIHNLNSANYDAIAPLLGWSPTVIVNSKVLAQVLNWGVKVDVVIYELQELELIDAQLKDKMEVKTEVIDEDAISTVLTWLLNRNYNAVTVVAGLNEAVTKLNNYKERLAIVIHGQSFRAYFVDKTYKKWVTQNTSFEVKNANSLKVQGAQKQQNIWVALNDGFVEFTSSSPFVLVEKL